MKLMKVALTALVTTGSLLTSSVLEANSSPTWGRPPICRNPMYPNCVPYRYSRHYTIKNVGNTWISYEVGEEKFRLAPGQMRKHGVNVFYETVKFDKNLNNWGFDPHLQLVQADGEGIEVKYEQGIVKIEVIRK